MTKRANLSADGPAIAKAGYDIDTASLSQMAFSPSMVSMRLRETGIVTPTNWSGSAFDHLYKRAIVYFSHTYTKPPLVFFVERISDTETDQSPFMLVGADYVGARHMTYTYVDRAEFYVNIAFGAGGYPIKYFVFDNTIED